MSSLTACLYHFHNKGCKPQRLLITTSAVHAFHKYIRFLNCLTKPTHLTSNSFFWYQLPLAMPNNLQIASNYTKEVLITVIPNHCFLTDRDHVTVIVKTMRSMTTFPSNVSHIPAFRNSTEWL